jgi:CRP-like cAMP-binding protein
LLELQIILQNIERHIALDEVERKQFHSLLSMRKANKKEIIQKAGETCQYLNFVCDGALRAYLSDESQNESIVMFAIRDWWITDMYAFTTGKPAMLNIDTLEPSTIFQLSKADFDNLLSELPKFEKFMRILMQNAYVREQLRVIQNLSMPAEQRYKNFLEKYPQFASRVPLKQIASYLGITPEFLSVLRKKFTKGDIS